MMKIEYGRQDIAKIISGFVR